VIVRNERNILINPRHPDFGRIRFGAPEKFEFDPRLKQPIAGNPKRRNPQDTLPRSRVVYSENVVVPIRAGLGDPSLLAVFVPKSNEAV
jgi:hypothetical protein